MKQNIQISEPLGSTREPRVVLIGMPNTGKSTLFNRITKAAASVGNWPGMTVSLLQAQVQIQGKTIEVVDLPGIYDLGGFSDDEKVVQDFLENFAVDLVIIVINSAQIDHQIRLLLQAKCLNLPILVILNMADEAQQYGIRIAVEELSRRLELPVILLSAKYGKADQVIEQAIEQAIAPSLFQSTPASPLPNLLACLGDQAAIAPATLENLLAGVVTLSPQRGGLTPRIDALLLHPVWGLPLFFSGMFLVFWLIWSLGLPAQGLMGQLTDTVQTWVLEPLLAPLPPLIQDFFINGCWNGLATVASFIPLILLFFILMAVLEDSGYLSRSAYLMDALMERLGLDGRSFVMQMLGFGCNVPALMGTRVMRSRSLRLLTMLVIPFSLCSARLQVFVFILTAVFSDQRGAIALFSLYLLSFAVALITAALLQNFFPHNEPFVLELPPYRWPTFRQVILRSWIEVRDFLTRASGFILVGCIAVWMVTNLPPGATQLDSIGGQMGQWLQPVMAPLGIDPKLTLALIFGFVAKEVVVGALAVIYGLGGLGLNDVTFQHTLGAQISFAQGYSFCIFCLLYTPCLATLSTLLNESRSWKFMLFSLGFSLLLAWASSFVFYQSALLLGFS